MNAVEIEEAVSDLSEQLFDRDEFAFQFLLAFGNKETAIKRLRSNANSDIPGAVLQKNNIHIATCAPGETAQTLNALREHPKTARNKCKFIVATDGEILEAEDTNTGEHIAPAFPDFAEHFGFFLPLAGISNVSQIKNNPIDIRATRHLNKLYIALLSENPDWATVERRHDLNQFMARLIFCFFAEDTGIFFGEDLFTKTIIQMSEPGSSNTHDVISELFRAMDMPLDKRSNGEVKAWANAFPYVNGGLFAGTRDVPKFSKMARATLLAAGGLKWTHINPDIFGSMIQAVADEDERETLGMHYTSVPNIMKVLGPLFLDNLKEKLDEAGDNPRKLLNLRKRLARIRVFDPACGSGNFLVIAYIRLREIEHEIIKRRKDDPKSVIKLTQFYGIELKSFPTEIARLALLIAEFQCNVRMIGQQEAILDILPLHQTGNIRCGNALRVDWLEVCPPPQPTLEEQDLAGGTGRLALDSEGKDWETYICGNPPYKGSKKRPKSMTADLGAVLSPLQRKWKDNDYVVGWFVKSAQYIETVNAKSGLVSTNSLNQGQQVDLIWPLIFSFGVEIAWAHESFKWSNLATNKATVTVTAIGLQPRSNEKKYLYSENEKAEKRVISPYLVESDVVSVSKVRKPVGAVATMKLGNMPYGAGLLLDAEERYEMLASDARTSQFIRMFAGGEEYLHSKPRFCLWISDEERAEAEDIPSIKKRIDEVKRQRLNSTDEGGRRLAQKPHQFRERNYSGHLTLVLPRTSSEARPYMPVGCATPDWIFSSETFALYDAPLWNMALIASKLHLVWIATVCGKMKTDFRYSNTLGWNTFPVPKLTATNKADLTRCAEDILLVRETHFPATIADLYDPEKMPENLRAAHERNDTVLEEIYIGRRFRNDTERLEKLFDMYTKMTKNDAA